MKLTTDLIVSVFSLFLLNNSVTHVAAFCSVATSAAPTKEKTTSFDISITSSLPTCLSGHKGDDEMSGTDSDDIFKKMAMNDIRKARLEKESLNQKRFASGEELEGLREDLESLRQNLEWAKALKDEDRIQSLEKAIRKGESRDPSFMYAKAKKIIAGTKQMKDVSEEEKKILIEKWSGIATDAREFLPQLNMEGLWVGK